MLSPRTWRLADLGAKHEFLRAGLGWGGMPLHMVERDLADGTGWCAYDRGCAAGRHGLPMSAVYRTDTPPGPGGPLAD